MIYFLWSLTFGAFFLFWKKRDMFSDLNLKNIFSNQSITKEKTSLLKKIGQRFVYEKHGFTTNFCANRTFFKNKCKKLGNFCSFIDYLNTKEIILKVLYFLGFGLILFGKITSENILWLFLLFVFVFSLPDLLLQIEKEKREKLFLVEVPYFIDLFIITLKTGLNIEKTLFYITQKNTFLNSIVSKKLAEIEFGKSLEVLFYELETEIQNKEFQSFLKQLRQANKLGVSLSQVLEIQSQAIRAKRKQRAEELSRTAGVKISLPLVLFIFPALLIIYVGPSLLSLLRY